MYPMPPLVDKLSLVLRPDSARTVIRPFVLTTSAEVAQISKCLTESLSIHPQVQDGLTPTMSTFAHNEILRPLLPVTDCQRNFRVPTVT